jgi:hypothetical protein
MVAGWLCYDGSDHAQGSLSSRMSGDEIDKNFYPLKANL